MKLENKSEQSRPAPCESNEQTTKKKPATPFVLFQPKKSYFFQTNVNMIYNCHFFQWNDICVLIDTVNNLCISHQICNCIEPCEKLIPCLFGKDYTHLVGQITPFWQSYKRFGGCGSSFTNSTCCSALYTNVNKCTTRIYFIYTSMKIREWCLLLPFSVQFCTWFIPHLWLKALCS